MRIGTQISITSLLLAVTLVLGCNKSLDPSSDFEHSNSASESADNAPPKNHKARATIDAPPPIDAPSPTKLELVKYVEHQFGNDDELRTWTFSGSGWKQMVAQLIVIADGKAVTADEVILDWEDHPGSGDVRLMLLTQDGKKFGAKDKWCWTLDAATDLDTPPSRMNVLNSARLVNFLHRDSYVSCASAPWNVSKSETMVVYHALYNWSHEGGHYPITKQRLHQLLIPARDTDSQSPLTRGRWDIFDWFTDATKEGSKYIFVTIRWEPRIEGDPSN